MAERYLPFDYTETDPREYEAAIWAAMQRKLVRDGVSPGFDQELEVVPTDPPTLGVAVSKGAGFIKGHFYVNDAPKILALDPADPTNPRIDRIVLRLDLRPDQRNILAVVKTGTPAPSPVPPDLTRDDYIWELSLAQVTVPAGATYVTESNITDERFDDTLCGRAVPPGFRFVHVSTLDPTPADGRYGDLWLKYEA